MSNSIAENKSFLRTNFLTRFFYRMPGLKAPLGLLIPLIIVVVALIIINPVFISQRNLLNILRSISIYLVMCSGMTIVMAGGGIDLSVGSTVALGANVSALLIAAGVNVPTAIIAAILVGIAAGGVNGLSVSIFKIPPLITTLATMVIFRGVNYLIMGEKIIRSFPKSFTFIGQGHLGPVPAIVIIGIVIILIAALFLNTTRSGKYILASGGNKVAAKRFGVHTDRYLFLSYVILGGLSGFAGVMLASRLNASQALLGIGMELHVITVVVLGGTLLFGGHATLLGTFLGALFLGVMENGLVLARVPFYYQQIVIGTILIVTVGIQLFRFRTSAISQK